MTNDPTTAPHPKAHAEAEPAATPFAEHKPKRTLGLKLFDNLLYTVFTNTTVFFASVGFTYMTMHGRSVGAEDSFIRKIGTWFAERREPIMNNFRKLGIKSEQAQKDFTTVFFSFLDGTIFSFMVKPLEDRREKIAKKIDDALGTSPENMKAYEAEPKQSWRSVVEGRILTSLLVVPVAMIMEKTGGNKAIFYNTGEKLASFVGRAMPKFDGWLSKKTIHDKNYFFQTGVFEAFYTSVCTGGLYLISRMVARKHPKPEHEAAAAPVTATPTRDEAPRPVAAADTPEKPAPTIRTPIHAERMATPEREAAFV